MTDILDDAEVIARVLNAERADGRVGGWAPGRYLCTCLHCGDHFEGDKRAMACLSCAQKFVATECAPTLARRLQQVSAELAEARRDREGAFRTIWILVNDFCLKRATISAASLIHYPPNAELVTTDQMDGSILIEARTRAAEGGEGNG